MGTQTFQVGASADDAWERNNGAIQLAQTAILLDDRNEWAGVRFTSVTVPQAETITSATLTLDLGGTGNIVGTVYGEDADSPGTFTTTTDDISSRTLTTASTAVNETGQSAAYDIDVTAIIQEIIGRTGWSSGNALVLIFDPDTGSNFTFTTYDGTPASAAQLEIVTPSGGAFQSAWAAHSNQLIP